MAGADELVQKLDVVLTAFGSRQGAPPLKKREKEGGKEMQNLHAHSVFCDGKNTPEEMIRACLAAGMDSAGISIHSPLPFANGWAAKAENVAPFLAEMRRLKAAYAGRIAVYAGVEWDVLSDEKWLEPFDYAIGSAHFLPVGSDPAAYPTVDDSPETTRRFLAEAFDGDSDAAAECYFAQLRRVADAPCAQVVGHFDLLTKFDEKERFFDETSPRYRAAALNAMDALVSAGKVFEVNTGAISRGWRTTPYPSRWILEQLRRRNARVTISSDSHHAATVDCAFDDAQRLLEACGFEEIWAFDGRAFVKRRIKE